MAWLIGAVGVIVGIVIGVALGPRIGRAINRWLAMACGF